MMKKLIAVILILVCIISEASAEFDQILLIKYNASAKTAGAPQLDKKNVISQDNMYIFTAGDVSVAFEMSSTGVKMGGVCALDDSCTADFICSCIAMIWTLGNNDINDITAIGMMTDQYASIRAGNDTDPFHFGMDIFQIVSNDSGKYFFVYMNNDGELN